MHCAKDQKEVPNIHPHLHAVGVTLAVIGGFLLLRFAHWLPGKLLNVLTDRYLMYWSNHFQAYLWLLKALFPAYLLTSVLTGCVVSLVAKKREMIPTMALGIVLCVMILFGYLSALAQTGDFYVLWNIPWAFSDPIAIILGGMAVRQFRIHVMPQPVAKNED